MIDDIRIPLPDKLIDHRAAIATLAGAGLKPPTAWLKLDQRLDDYLQLRSPAMDNLVGSIVRPDASDDRVLLRALALSEANASHHTVAVVNAEVVNAVLAKLIELYEPAAADLYGKAAAMFNATAQAFSAAASVIDPETSAVLMVNKPDVERTAWSQAEDLAARLTTLLPVVATAASLAGIPGIDPDVDNDPVLIGLTVDTTNLHRRRLYESWLTKDGDGRTGRWGSLVALGATIRACPDLAGFQVCPEPRELKTRKVQIAQGEYRTEVHDPEDADYRREPIDPRRRSGRVTTA